MVEITFRVPRIENNPLSQDARALDETYIIRGKNYLFDSKGPKSGFSSRMLTPFPLHEAKGVHGVRVENRAFVFTADSILTWRNALPQSWDILYHFGGENPGALDDPWSVIYFAGLYRFAQRGRGYFEAPPIDGTDRLKLEYRNAEDIPGLLWRIRAMGTVRNRAIIVNDSTIQWSNTSDLSDLTPSLGGAGFQMINDFVQGTFRALTTFDDGFIVWSTDGAIAAEFIGGEAVWRFFPLITKERPIGNWCTIRLSNGLSVFLSQHGLMTVANTQSPQPWVQDFNEYFREYVKDAIHDLKFWRLEYDYESETIYIMESGDGIVFWRAHVVSPTINRWGEFSEMCYGILPITPTLFGYVDRDMQTHYFMAAHNRECLPDNSRGLNRHYPRIQKDLQIPSSTGVCRSGDWDTTLLLPDPNIPAAGWYAPGSTVPALAELRGMDSMIEIGYLRPRQWEGGTDQRLEIQGLTVGSTPSKAPAEEDFTTSWKPGYFYDWYEDWNADIILIPGNQIEDYNLTNGTTDYLRGQIGSSEDYLNRNFPTYIDTSPAEDWNLAGETEDWNGPTIHLTQEVTHELAILSSGDGITVDEYTPVMSRFNSDARTYSVGTDGVMHRLRISANALGQYYHVTYLELTMDTNGMVT